MAHHVRHFSGDPYAMSGAWSPPTSAANFCEEDYVITQYVAEFVNALTNFAYVYFAIRYMYPPGNRGYLSPQLDYASVSLLVVGVASFLYHATLRQTMQFADDLSMIVLCWALLRALLIARQPPKKALFITAGLSLGVLLFSGFYIWSGKIIYHFSAFCTMLFLIVLRARYVLYWAQPPLPSSKRHDWSIRAWKAIFIFLFGFLIWNIDLEYCANLRAIRERVGLPWAWLFEFHAWWHIFTSIGAYQFMEIVREMCKEMDSDKKHV